MKINQLLNLSRTAPANATISGTASSGGLIEITTSADHDMLTDDIVSISGVVGTVEANGVWVITKVDATHFTLNNSTFHTDYSSGGTVAFEGFVSTALLVDNTVFTSTVPSWIFSVTVQELTADSSCRVGLQDAADSAFVTTLPIAGPSFSFLGGIGLSYDVSKSAKADEWPDLRLGESGDNIRAVVTNFTAGNTIQLIAEFNY